MTAVQRSTDRTEQRSRLSALRERLDLDVVALTSYQGVSYFAGTTIITQNSLPDRLEFFFQFADASPALLLCNIETGMAREQTDITDITEYTEFVDVPAEAAAKLLQERGISTGRIGIEAKRLPTEAHRDLRDKLPRAEFVPIDDELERLQSVKTESEIDMLRFAAEKTLEAVLAAAAAAKPGDGELSVCAEMTTRMMAAGGIYNFMVFGTGRRAMGAHVEATNRPLQEGEIWRVDLGADSSTRSTPTWLEWVSSERRRAARRKSQPRFAPSSKQATTRWSPAVRLARSSTPSRPSSSASASPSSCRTSVTAWGSGCMKRRFSSPPTRRLSKREWS